MHDMVCSRSSACRISTRLQGGQRGLLAGPHLADISRLCSALTNFWRQDMLALLQGGERGLPALPSVPDLGLRGMPAIALPSNPTELWAPLPAPNENNIFATHTAEAVRPYTTFYKALPHVPGSAVQPGRRLAQMPPANDPSKPAQPFGYRQAPDSPSRSDSLGGHRRSQARRAACRASMPHLSEVTSMRSPPRPRATSCRHLLGKA